MLLGLLLALATSVCWALGNVYIQKSGRAIGAPRALLWALAAGGALSGACALAFDRRTAPIGAATLAWLAAAAVSGVLAYAGLFFAFARARLSVAVPFVASWSVVAALLSIALLGERPRLSQLVGGALVLLGVVAVARGSSRDAQGGRTGAGGEPGERRRARGALLAALGSAVAFGVMVPAMGQVAPALGEFGASAAVYGLGIALALPVAWVVRVELGVPPPGARGVVLATGLFETAGFVAVTIARGHAPMALVAPVASLSSALTVLYAWIVLRERPDPLAAAGAAVACAGLVVLGLGD